MFVFSAISQVFRIQIWGYKPYVRFPCDFCSRSHINLRLQTLCSFSVQFFSVSKTNLRWETLCSFSERFLQSFAYKSELTNPMFAFSAISVVFRIQIWGYKPYVHFQCGFRSISHTNLRLQTLCSCFVWFMQYFAYKSEVTNPMFVFRAISAVFRIQIRGYKPYVRVSCDFWCIFAYKSEVTNPMFVFLAIYAVLRI